MNAPAAPVTLQGRCLDLVVELRNLAASLPPATTPQAVFDNLADADVAILRAARTSVLVPTPTYARQRFILGRIAAARRDRTARATRMGRA